MGSESITKYSSQSFGVSATKGVLFMLTLKSCFSLLIKNISNMSPSNNIFITVMFNFFFNL